MAIQTQKAGAEVRPKGKDRIRLQESRGGPPLAGLLPFSFPLFFPSFSGKLPVRSPAVRVSGPTKVITSIHNGNQDLRNPISHSIVFVPFSPFFPFFWIRFFSA